MPHCPRVTDSPDGRMGWAAGSRDEHSIHFPAIATNEDVAQCEALFPAAFRCSFGQSDLIDGHQIGHEVAHLLIG